MTDDCSKAVREFIEAFESVFDTDWKYTQSMLGVYAETAEQKTALTEAGLETIHMISPSGTFLNPAVEDEIENWGNRSLLLDRYRKLKSLISN